ncbi:cell division initiation protein DivIVA [Gottschalkia purinilytica]|uniref:Cell division initiation protein DivIVA n=1 Tax=Gottschalkia purinilytica TaxID=1503 RepID=A0A0L0WB22_GOTPU|nr:DivIVA domain-containing protein [Gottschalkia purinilytica]KNF08724.1 cell division initiation protein DivIVA [Gottschalkia purinilytica]
MLTPLDIQNKEFSKGLRGYREAEVDSFLDEIILDYEKIYKENVELKDKISMLNDQVKHYSSLEQTLQKTLVVAQSAAEEVTANAKHKADLIVREAEENAKKVIDNSQNEVLRIKNEYEVIRKDMMLFKTRFKTLLKSQIESIDSYVEDGDIPKAVLDEKNEENEALIQHT